MTINSSSLTYPWESQSHQPLLVSHNTLAMLQVEGLLCDTDFSAFLLVFCTRFRATCFSQLVIAVTKTPDKNNLEEERFILAHGFRCQSMVG